MQIGFLTACMGRKSLEEVVAFAGKAGFAALEVSTGHLPADKALQETGKVKDLFAKHGVGISSIAAYANLLDLVGRLNYQRRILVLDAVGDRRDQDIEELARISARHVDLAIIYEDKDRRGRREGEVAALLERGFAAVGYPSEQVVTILDEWQAVDHALSLARPRDLVVYMTGRVRRAIHHVYEHKERVDPVAPPPAWDGGAPA